MFFYIINIFIFIIIDIAIYRKIKKNFFIDFIIISFPLFIFLSTINIIYFEKNYLIVLMLFLNYLFFLIIYVLIFLGIDKTSPSLFIIHQLIKKNSSFIDIKKKFINQNFFKIRFIENRKSDLIKVKANKLVLMKKGKLILSLFNFLKILLKIKI